MGPFALSFAGVLKVGGRRLIQQTKRVMYAEGKPPDNKAGYL